MMVAGAVRLRTMAQCGIIRRNNQNKTSMKTEQSTTRTERIVLNACYVFAAALGIFACWYIAKAIIMVIPHINCSGH